VTGTGARKEPLTIVISTQSPDPNHVMSELVDYGLKIEEGTLPPDPAFHYTIYTAPEDSDPWDEKVWFASILPWMISDPSKKCEVSQRGLGKFRHWKTSFEIYT
jgi:phage terminase large subunit-like protein